jgi:hypothetical protein
MLHPTLTPGQLAEADRITGIRMAAAHREIREIAELVASKPDHELLGKTEFEVRRNNGDVPKSWRKPAVWVTSP